MESKPPRHSNGNVIIVEELPIISTSLYEELTLKQCNYIGMLYRGITDIHAGFYHPSPTKVIRFTTLHEKVVHITTLGLGILDKVKLNHPNRREFDLKSHSTTLPPKVVMPTI